MPLSVRLQRLYRSPLGELARCGGSSLAAWAIEFGLLSFFVSVLHVFYLLAAVFAGGGFFVVNFFLTRRWGFEAHKHQSRLHTAWQMLKHAIVVGGSFLVSLPLLWLCVQRVHMNVQIGWMVAGTSAFFVWTYPMHRYYTYRAKHPKPAATSDSPSADDIAPA